MVRCWCHAAMTGWLCGWASAVALPSPGRLRRWQQECERAGGDCAARVEAVALRLPVTRAVRQDGLLRLYTSAGVFDFVDAAQPGAPTYRYLGWVEHALLHLVWRGSAAGAGFIAVNEFTGARSEYGSLAELPAVSVPRALAPPAPHVLHA